MSCKVLAIVRGAGSPAEIGRLLDRRSLQNLQRLFFLHLTETTNHFHSPVWYQLENRRMRHHINTRHERV